MPPPPKRSAKPYILLIMFCLVITVSALAVYKYISRLQHNIKSSSPLYTVALTADADSIVVAKSIRTMSVFSKGKVVKLYHISLGSQPVGAKHFEGDGKTPEGHYYICVKNTGSKYHKSLGVSYPNDNDRSYAKKHNRPTGGDIMIHGLPNNFTGNPNAYTSIDWTAGCISVNNQQIDELFAHISMRTPVNILP